MARLAKIERLTKRRRLITKKKVVRRIMLGLLILNFSVFGYLGYMLHEVSVERDNMFGHYSRTAKSFIVKLERMLELYKELDECKKGKLNEKN